MWRQRQRLRHRQGRHLALYLRRSPYMGQWMQLRIPWMDSRRPSGPCPSKRWWRSLQRGRERARGMPETEQTKERSKGKTRRMSLPSKTHQALLASMHHPLP